jgi:glycosyl transferase family 2
VTRQRIPEAILDAAHARSRARAARDWPEADRLKAVIEGGGWKVVDRGTDFALEPAAPPDVVEEGRVRYGSSASVPSRLDEAAVGTATVVLVATDRPEDVDRVLSAVREHAPDGTQLVVVANTPTTAQAVALEALEAVDPGGPGIGTEVLWTSERLGHAAALNAGIRRAEAAIVLLLDETAEPAGDLITPLAELLADETVAVAGPWGVQAADPASGNLRRPQPAAGEVAAIDGACLAFRRADYVERGPLDEQFRANAWLDVWWSLVLRESTDWTPPRRALAQPGLPVARGPGGPPAETPEVARQSKRNYYRVLERFRASGLLRRRALTTGDTTSG